MTLHWCEVRGWSIWPLGDSGRVPVVMPWNDLVLAVTHLGNSVLMLSSAFVLGVWFALGSAWRVSLKWAWAVGVAVLLVLATKVAFFGWGVGIALIDFTGISGHAMLATAVLPALAAAMTVRLSLQMGAVAVGIAFVVAIAVGLTRIELGAHSLSEVLLGWGVGLVVAVLVLRALYAARHVFSAESRFLLSPWPLVVANAMLLIATAPRGGRAGLETHGLVIQLALWVSGRAEPFTRSMLHS
jgi:membrane-associated phospholipid phosphatase